MDGVHPVPIGAVHLRKSTGGIGHGPSPSGGNRDIGTDGWTKHFNGVISLRRRW